MKEKIIGLVSGGIDSPVACAMVADKFEIIPLHFCLYPLSSKEDSLRAIEMLEDFKEKAGFERVIIFPWAGILKSIRSEIEDRYACVACRRSMLLSAEMLCDREGAGGIVTGESLGQKASQTLENIGSTSSGVEYPILRPLLGLDKNEIIERSKEMGIWRAKHAGCCLATPEKPRTKSDSQIVEEKVEKIEIRKLIQEWLDSSLNLEEVKGDSEEFLFELAERFG